MRKCPSCWPVASPALGSGVVAALDACVAVQSTPAGAPVRPACRRAPVARQQLSASRAGGAAAGRAPRQSPPPCAGSGRRSRPAENRARRTCRARAGSSRPRGQSPSVMLASRAIAADSIAGASGWASSRVAGARRAASAGQRASTSAIKRRCTATSATCVVAPCSAPSRALAASAASASSARSGSSCRRATRSSDRCAAPRSSPRSRPRAR